MKMPREDAAALLFELAGPPQSKGTSGSPQECRPGINCVPNVSKTALDWLPL